MIYMVLFIGGILLGAIAGRWWVLVVGGVLGIWIAFNSPLELPGWFVGLVYGSAATAGMASGVFLRKSLRGRPEG